MESAPASRNAGMWRSGSSIMRCRSRCSRVAFRIDFTTGGPIVMSSTKRPSITSKWSMDAPPRSTRAISSARRAKSAERIEGTISAIYGLSRFYHSSKKTVPGIATGDTVKDLGELHWRDEGVPRGPGGAPHKQAINYLFVFFRFERASGVDHPSAGGQRNIGIGQQGRLAALEIEQVVGAEAPLDFGIPAQGAGAGTGCIYENALEPAGERKGLRAIQN